MKKIIIAIVGLSLFLTACSKIMEGEIYEKEFVPERTWVSMVPIVHTDGKTTFTTMIPIIYHHADEWVIRIRSLDGKDTATYYVKEDVYNACEVGMMFEFDEKRGDLSQEPLEKERQ